MRNLRRRTTPRVRDGAVQKKHRDAFAYDASWDLAVPPAVSFRRAGRGYRHVVEPEEVERFVTALPEWPVSRRDLRALVLAPGEPDVMGYYRAGHIALCAWPREMALLCDEAFVEEHRVVFGRLGVPVEVEGRDLVAHFDRQTARCFTLVHVLLHELGHHHDRISTRRALGCGRGEPFAERFADERLDEALAVYARVVR